MTSLLYSHDDCLAHVNPPGHPEQVARLGAVHEALSAPEFAALERRTAPLAERADLALAHPDAYVEAIKAATPAEGWAQLDPDTTMSPGSWQAALRAVGANIAAVDAVLDGEAANAFVACRPPGHHAERSRAMGFCLLSNIAIAALHALDRRGLDRVAVLDFDVHHGNGTQDVLWNEPRARFASTHQMPLYPGTGAEDERGAFDNIINVPLRAATGGVEMRAAWEARILPTIAGFSPELILISAGFDAHAADPLAGLNWATGDFAWLTGAICDLAANCCEGRVVSTLEGGYDLAALGGSVAAHVKVLMERGQA